MKNILRKLVFLLLLAAVFKAYAETSFPANGDIITIERADKPNVFYCLNENGEFGEGRNWFVWTSTDYQNVYAQLKTVIKAEKMYFVTEAGEGKNLRVVPPPTWPAWVGVGDSKNWGKNEQFLLKEVQPGLFKLYSYATESWLLETDPGRGRFHSPIQVSSAWKRSTEKEALLLKVQTVKAQDLAAKKAADDTKQAVKKTEVKVSDKKKDINKEVLAKDAKKVEVVKGTKKTGKAVQPKKTKARKVTPKKIASTSKKPRRVKKPGQKKIMVKARPGVTAKKAVSKSEDTKAKITKEAKKDEEAETIKTKKVVGEKAFPAIEKSTKQLQKKKTVLLKKPAQKTMIRKSRVEILTEQPEKKGTMPAKKMISKKGQKEEEGEEESEEEEE